MATQNNADQQETKTQSGNHAAGIQANDNPSTSRQRSIEDSDGGMNNVEDGIAGTHSGTEGDQNGQGIKQQPRRGGPGENREDEHQGGPGNRQSAQKSERYDSEQSGRYGAGTQQGMQGQGGEPGHDIDDIGNKQSGAPGARGGNPQDQSSR
jgi:hypothetical protein